MIPALFSLHTCLVDRECRICGNKIPASKDHQYWRIKGGLRGCPRVICCLCQALFIGIDDGWTTPADGKTIITQLIPRSAP